ncbi:hypothetical protein ABPG75_008678 [Micractinium tetrahymenae]
MAAQCLTRTGVRPPCRVNPESQRRARHIKPPGRPLRASSPSRQCSGFSRASVTCSMARRGRDSPAKLLCLFLALALAPGLALARAQTLNDTTNATALPDYWLACGRNQPCDDASACCAIWGVCGNTDRFCGQYCLSGACIGRASPPPPLKAKPPPPGKQPGSPPPAATQPSSPPPSFSQPSPPPPSPPDDAPPTVDPTQFVDAVVSVREGEVALAACAEPGWIISSVDNAMYGDVATQCNSTVTYMIVSAACVWQPACMVPAVNAVFDDPCPRVYKTLQFGYRCQPEVDGVPSAPPPSQSDSPPSWADTEVPFNPFDNSPPPPDSGSSGALAPPPVAAPSPPTALPSPPPRASPSPPRPRPPSPSPPPPSPSPRPPSPPPSPRPSPPPPGLPTAPADAQLSPLWGENGELFSPRSMMSDWSQAGYAANLQDIPSYPAKYNVKSMGARGDGNADDTAVFLLAIAQASAEAKRTGQGVAVLVPKGRYRITQTLVIGQSNVVLRGEGPGATTLYFPKPLAAVYGTGTVWAFGGTWLTVLGNNADSSDTRNYKTDITADVAQGDKRVKVASTAGIQPGQWLRIFAVEPDDRNRRRQLLSALPGSGASSVTSVTGALGHAAGRRRLRDSSAVAAAPAPVASAGSAPAPAPGPAEAAADKPLVEQLFDDPALQQALAAAFEAEAKLRADAADGKVPSQSFEPNATNPLGMDPWLLAAARYAALALLAEPAGDPDKAPAQALSGTLDAYIYGENVVDSGRDGGVYPQADHIRFIARVSAVGPSWIEFERSIPYGIRLKWKPVVHVASATVQNSGFEGFTVEFPWSVYPSHLDVKGYNAFGIYGGINCWMRNLKIINADNGYIVNGADFVTVTGVETDFTKQRAGPGMNDRNGHHGLWIQGSSNVIMTNFTISNYRWYHDLSLAIFSELCVFSNGKGVDVNIDSHRGGTHHNLLSNINVGRGTRPFQSGGAQYRGAHSGANVTWWNLQRADGGAIALPPCDYGPLLLFAGSWLPPSASGGDASADSINLPLASAAGMGGTAAPAPAAVAPTADSPADDSQRADDTRAGALAAATGWCSWQRWRVELVSAGYQLWPADLATAQVAARKRGGVL